MNSILWLLGLVFGVLCFLIFLLAAIGLGLVLFIAIDVLLDRFAGSQWPF